MKESKLGSVVTDESLTGRSLKKCGRTMNKPDFVIRKRRGMRFKNPVFKSETYFKQFVIKSFRLRWSLVIFWWFCFFSKNCVKMLYSMYLWMYIYGDSLVFWESVLRLYSLSQIVCERARVCGVCFLKESLT